MNYWYILNDDMRRYLELNILPNLVAFAIADMHYRNLLIDENYDSLYNAIKSLINVTNENKNIIDIAIKVILDNKYQLKITSYSPIAIIELKHRKNSV